MYLWICTLICLLLQVTNISSTKMDEPVSIHCITCIIHASTGANFKNKNCTNEVCGPYAFTKNYWIDAGKPMTNRISSDKEDAFEICANSPVCGYFLVQMYMEKFKKDCNDDGVIDCEDFIRIHKLGPEKCHEELPEYYLGRYEYCNDVDPLV